MNLDEPYLRQVGQAHIETSTAALSELADIVSTRTGAAPNETLRIRLGHLDHGGFLTHLLHGFAMKQLTPDGFLGSRENDDEVLYAIVINQTLDVQLRTALASIGTYLARHDVIRTVRHGDQDATDLDKVIIEVDRQAGLSLEDSLRVNDWRATALALRERARTAGLSLQVRFASPILEAEEVRCRVPALRRVYNQVTPARLAVDRVAAAMSIGLTVGGEGVSQSALTFARELLDVGAVRRYTAHLARDAFVCGNGFLEVRPPPASLRLLRPESVDVEAEHRFVVTDSTTGAVETLEGPHILHLRGMHQTGGLVGLSVLEPLVVLLAQLDVAQAAVEDIPMAIRVGTDMALDWSKRISLLAERVKDNFDARVAELLGGGTVGLSAAPPELYFQGQALMEPASPRLRFIDDTDGL